MIEPLFPARRRLGRPRTKALRERIDAILDVLSSGRPPGTKSFEASSRRWTVRAHLRLVWPRQTKLILIGSALSHWEFFDFWDRLGSRLGKTRLAARRVRMPAFQVDLVVSRR